MVLRVSRVRVGESTGLQTYLQIADQAVKGFSISGMLVPISEITNMSCASHVGRPWLRCFHYGFIDADRETNGPLFAVFPFVCSIHFTFHPTALNRLV